MKNLKLIIGCIVACLLPADLAVADCPETLQEFAYLELTSATIDGVAADTALWLEEERDYVLRGSHRSLVFAVYAPETGEELYQDHLMTEVNP